MGASEGKGFPSARTLGNTACVCVPINIIKIKNNAGVNRFIFRLLKFNENKDLGQIFCPNI
jgi:hypothetical protein